MSFPNRQVSEKSSSFGFLKEVSPVLSLLEASDSRLWKSKTTSTDSPLVYLLPPSKTRLLRNRGHSYVLPQIRTEHFKRLLLIDAFSILFNCLL